MRPTPMRSRLWLVAVAYALAGSGYAVAQVARPVTLPEALRLAGVGSQPVAAADAAVRAAEGRARQAALPPNPEAIISVENVAGTGPYTGFGATETTLSIGQRLEIGGKRSARTAAARAETSVARLRLALARADLIQDVKLRFADAVAADGRLRLAQQALDLNGELLRVATGLVDAGREPPLRALRARTAAAETQVAVNTAASERATALRALAALWGGGEIAGVASVPELSIAGPLAPDPTQTIDVLVATSEVASATAAIRRERTLAVPGITAQAGLRDIRETGDRALVFGLSVPLPFWNRNQGNVEAARADQISAEARRNQAIIEARRRIGDARAGLFNAEAQLKLLRNSSLPAAEEAARLARLGYQAGKFALIDVLDAQTALATARRALVDAELAQARSAAALDRASDTQEILA